MSQPSPADPSNPYKIFISYRREDSQATVDRIYDWLVLAFTSSLGPKAIFKDVDSIPSGFGFPGVVNSTMRQCRVVLIVIGPSWTTLLSDKEPYKGQPRLNDPADNVRVEVEQALALAPINDAGEPASDLLLIPVLVQGVRMPGAEQLPASLRPLVERNGRSIRPDPDFAYDTQRLITRMAEWMGVTADDPRVGHFPATASVPLPSSNDAPPSGLRVSIPSEPVPGDTNFFGKMRTFFFGRRQPKQRPAPVDIRDLAIFGFGAPGSNFAVGVCEQVSRLAGSVIWLTGIYTSKAARNLELQRRLQLSRAAGHNINVSAIMGPMNAASDLVQQLENQYRIKPDDEKRLIWVAAGNDLTLSLPALKKLGKENDIQNVRLVIVWLVPEPEEIDEKMRASATELQDWSSDPESILMTTLVIQDYSPLAVRVGAKEQALLHRSVAALLTTDSPDETAYFATIAMQLKNSGYSFSALTAGSIGVDASPVNFREDGGIFGNRGEINPRLATAQLEVLARMAFQEQALSTVTDPLSAVQFVNIIVPARRYLRQVSKFQAMVSYWLRDDFGVTLRKVTVTRLFDERDRGIDISLERPEFTGDFYLHFTAFRGIGIGHGEIPKDLQSGISPSK